jgi:uncharacterized protein (DUF1800 family)
MLDDPSAAIAANRFGLGARPGELRSVASDPRGWLSAQLKGAPAPIASADLTPSQVTLAQALELRRDIQQQRKAQRVDPAMAQEQLQKVGQFLRPIYVSEATARFAQAVQSERPFLERITQFWSNHFAVSADKQFLAGLAGSFEREAIRPNVLGRFSDLLLAAESHPAMLLYLDNHLSVGPHSQAAARLARRDSERKIGINENLAREILELHTLGVGGGYTQTDVTTFAEVITGWSIGDIRGRFPGGEPGRFLFRAEVHEPGAKVVLNTHYPDTGFGQGVAVLNNLARQGATAHFIATKLARHFIADDPPPAAVKRIEGVYLASEGDLPSVYRALIAAREAWSEPLSKYKTPNDYITSAYRGLALPVEAGKGALAAFELLGQRNWQPGSPAGWPDRSADWDGASALMKRIEWADALGARLGSRLDAQHLAPELLGANLTQATRTAVARATGAEQAVTLLLAAPEFMRR